MTKYPKNPSRALADFSENYLYTSITNKLPARLLYLIFFLFYML